MSTSIIEVHYKLFDLGPVDLSKSSFKARFDLFLMWTECEPSTLIEPTVRFPSAKTFLITSRLNLAEEVKRGALFSRPSSTRKKSVRLCIEGDFKSPMALQNFPFDKQLLKIDIVLARDLNTGRDLTLDDQYRLIQSKDRSNKLFATSNQYNLGKPSSEVPSDGSMILNEDKGSAMYTIMIPAQRRAQYYLLNHYCFVLAVIIMSFGVFFLTQTEPWQNRDHASQIMSLTLSLFLSLVAFKIAVSSSLPQLEYTTHFDRYVLLAFAILILQFVGYAWCVWMFDGYQWSLDFLARFLFTLCVLGHAYVALTLYFSLDNSISSSGGSVLGLKRHSFPYSSLADTENTVEDEEAKAGEELSFQQQV